MWGVAAKRTRKVRNMVESIKIKNFKSLADTELTDCRRYNLLLGRPNVGKSNILEALSLFSVPYLMYSKREVRDLVRYSSSMNELFFNGNTSEPVSITAGEHTIRISNTDGVKYIWDYANGDKKENLVINSGKVASKRNNSVLMPEFKKYDFKKLDNFSVSDIPFLLPAGGENIMQIIQNDASLTDEIREIVAENDLQLLFDTATREIKFQKQLNATTVFSIPFFSVSDTLQRLIFYKAAISSNKDSVIMLEEIEAHSYPPFISKVTASIIEDKNNQYFITTHSPYVVNDFLELPTDEVAVYLIDQKEGKTVIRRLTDEELNEVYNAGIDLFFNYEMYLE